MEPCPCPSLAGGDRGSEGGQVPPRPCPVAQGAFQSTQPVGACSRPWGDGSAPDSRHPHPRVAFAHVCVSVGRDLSVCRLQSLQQHVLLPCALPSTWLPGLCSADPRGRCVSLNSVTATAQASRSVLLCGGMFGWSSFSCPVNGAGGSLSLHVSTRRVQVSVGHGVERRAGW